MKQNSLICAVIAGGLLAGGVVPAAEAQSGRVAIEANANTVTWRMASGIGASWHAIETPMPVEGDRSHGGSAWGGNPPAEDERAWASLARHAQWLGMDFCRVEVEQRMYQPQREEYTWDSPEMRVLYRILDICEAQGTDVFLQQMWANVAWNAFPEFRDDPIKRLHSGPVSTEDYAEGIGALAEHLVKKKRYKCIKWIAINNEPGAEWSWWQSPPNQPMPIGPGLKAVRAALDRRGISIPLSGPDMTDLPPLKVETMSYDDHVGAYDLHSYLARFDWATGEGYPLQEAELRVADWVGWAHSRNKPFFLSELGTMVFGWKGSHAGPSTYDAALKDAELVLRFMNRGVDGFNRWSFVNRGDLDGQWQMVNTWNSEKQRLLEAFSPNPNPYFIYGALSRFTAKRSSVLATSVSGGQIDGLPRVFTAALRSPGGKFTCFVLNDSPQEWPANVLFKGLKRGIIPAKLRKYQVKSELALRVDLRLDPLSVTPVTGGDMALLETLPPRSLTIYTTYNLAHEDKGITAE